jgi:hypothetical protein
MNNFLLRLAPARALCQDAKPADWRALNDGHHMHGGKP